MKHGRGSWAPPPDRTTSGFLLFLLAFALVFAVGVLIGRSL